MAAVTSPTAAFTTVSLLASLTLLGYAAYVVLYRLFLHPLKSFPGPKLAAASFLYEIYFDVCKAPGGQYIYEIERLHEIYGPVVRINPEEIHVKDSEWFDVLFAGPGHVRNKSERANRANGATGSVASTVRHDLHRLRRSAINPFFSKRAVTQLEDKVRSKIDLMCERLRERATSGEVVNIGGAFTAVTLDVISEYCYDESYNALDTPDLGVKWNKVMGGIFESVPVTKHFPVVGALMQALPPSVIKLLNPDLELFMTTKAMTDNQSKKVWEEVQNKKEKSSTTEAQGRPRTIFHGIMESSLPVTEKSVERLCDEAFVLVVAGGETTARVSTVILVGLLKKPDLFARLRRDIDAATKDGFPDGQRLEGIAFMKAVVQEGVRMAAPVTNRPIQVAPNEDLECHDWILPRGTCISMSLKDVLFDATIFPDPHDFDPDRWLRAAEQGERLDRYLVTFMKGSRGCVGINLAYSEMYLAIAAIVHGFDVELYDFDAKRDLDTVRDCFIGLPSKESKGVRVRLRPRVP